MARFLKAVAVVSLIPAAAGSLFAAPTQPSSGAPASPIAGTQEAAKPQAEAPRPAVPPAAPPADPARSDKAGDSSARPAESSAPKERPPYVDTRRPTTTLRVQLVIARYEGEKKIATLPYTFLVASTRSTHAESRVRMRMGIDTPVPTVTYDGSTGEPRTTGLQYRTVGTNIDCWAADLGDGTYQLNMTVENSSALPSPDASLTNPNPSLKSVLGAPLFRRFETFVNPILRNGQTVQTIASTDPVTGEIVRIDTTLNVVATR